MKSVKDLMDYIFDIDDDYVVIEGYCDIILEPQSNLLITRRFLFKNINKDHFWKIIGRGDDDAIIDELKYLDCEVNLEGEYEFKAILKWYDIEEFNESGVSYLEIEHIEFTLIQTLVERERNKKIESIIDDSDIF